MQIFIVKEVKRFELEFKAADAEDAPILKEFFKNCNYGLCEYSIGTVMMWRRTLGIEWTIIEDCLVMCYTVGGKRSFLYPVPNENGDASKALDAIERYCAENAEPLSYCVISEELLTSLITKYPNAHIANRRAYQDYIYNCADLQNFSGRKYSGQRNHINKFRSLYPNAYFKKLTVEDKDAIDEFWAFYEEEFSKTSDKGALAELSLAEMMFSMLGDGFFVAGGMFNGDKIIALSMAEKCGDTLIIHIEKALYSYTGVYPTIVQEFANAFGEGCKYLNREDDSGTKGLRISKLQYGPSRMGAKYSLDIKNELCSLKEIPEINTQRLTLSAIRDEDENDYNAIVLDRELNALWGYDDVKNSGGATFTDIAKKDFENRMALNFAIRLEGKMIGEAVLYSFDSKGGAELGCRIAREYHGNGYGTEAFAAVAEWAIYKLGLRRVTAKCFKENNASYKMIAEAMRKTGSDDEFFYFEKVV